MKYMLGYIIVHPKLEDIILTNINNIIPETPVLFIYDGCTPNNYLKRNVGYIINDKERFEHYCNNKMIEYFTNQTNKDVLIVLHEDMYLNGNTILSDLDKLFGGERDNNIGLIGGRDGFEPGYKQMYSSPFSKSSYYKLLNIGEFREVPLLNFGPIAYHRKVIENIGLLDEEYNFAYAEQDYCMKAISRGYKNYVIGMDLRHDKTDPIYQDIFRYFTPIWMVGDNDKLTVKERQLLYSRWGV